MLNQVLVSGLATGSIYALMGLAFALAYSTMGLINLAQGEFCMLGAYIGLTLFVYIGVPYIASFFLSVLAISLLAFFLDLSTFRSLRRRGVLAGIIGGIGLSIALQNIAQLCWRAQPETFPSYFGNYPIKLASIIVIPEFIAVIFITLILMGVLYFFLVKTEIGTAMRATAQDQMAALLMGISIKRMDSVAQILCGVLGASSGILVAPFFAVYPTMGVMVAVKGLIAAILGGFGSIPGAIVGGFGLGLIETLGSAYISSAYKDILVFIVLVIILSIRPTGIFEEKGVYK
jgi:branched-chain amino acid transport system permease protein